MTQPLVPKDNKPVVDAGNALPAPMASTEISLEARILHAWQNRMGSAESISDVRDLSADHLVRLLKAETEDATQGEICELLRRRGEGLFAVTQARGSKDPIAATLIQHGALGNPQSKSTQDLTLATDLEVSQTLDSLQKRWGLTDDDIRSASLCHQTAQLFAVPRLHDRIFGHIFLDFMLDGTGLEGGCPSDSIACLVAYLEAIPHSPETEKLVAELKKMQTLYEALDESKFPQLAGNHVAFKEFVVNTFAKALDELKPGETGLIPSGWEGGNNGHVIILEFMKTQEGRFRLRVHNTGAGVKYHPSVFIEGKKKFKTIVQFDDIEERELFSRPSPGKYASDFFSKVAELHLFPRWEERDNNNIVSNFKFDAADIYQNLLKPFLMRQQVVGDDVVGFATPQRSGTCSWRPFTSLWRSRFDNGTYKRQKHDFRLKMLVMYVLRNKKELPQDSKKRLLVKEAMRKLARETYKLTVQSTEPVLSQQEAKTATATFIDIERFLEHCEKTTLTTSNQGISIPPNLPLHKTSSPWLSLLLENPVADACQLQGKISPHTRFPTFNIHDAMTSPPAQLLQMAVQGCAYDPNVDPQQASLLIDDFFRSLPVPKKGVDPYWDGRISDQEVQASLAAISKLMASYLQYHQPLHDPISPEELITVRHAMAIAHQLSLHCDTFSRPDVSPEARLSSYPLLFPELPNKTLAVHDRVLRQHVAEIRDYFTTADAASVPCISYSNFTYSDSNWRLVFSKDQRETRQCKKPGLLEFLKHLLAEDTRLRTAVADYRKKQGDLSFSRMDEEDVIVMILMTDWLENGRSFLWPRGFGHLSFLNNVMMISLLLQDTLNAGRRVNGVLPVDRAGWLRPTCTPCPETYYLGSYQVRIGDYSIAPNAGRYTLQNDTENGLLVKYNHRELALPGVVTETRIPLLLGYYQSHFDRFTFPDKLDEQEIFMQGLLLPSFFGTARFLHRQDAFLRRFFEPSILETFLQEHPQPKRFLLQFLRNGLAAYYPHPDKKPDVGGAVFIIRLFFLLEPYLTDFEPFVSQHKQEFVDCLRRWISRQDLTFVEKTLLHRTRVARYLYCPPETIPDDDLEDLCCSYMIQNLDGNPEGMTSLKSDARRVITRLSHRIAEKMGADADFRKRVLDRALTATIRHVAQPEDNWQGQFPVYSLVTPTGRFTVDIISGNVIALDGVTRTTTLNVRHSLQKLLPQISQSTIEATITNNIFLFEITSPPIGTCRLYPGTISQENPQKTTSKLQRFMNNHWWELVDKKYLEASLPPHLVHDYDHWVRRDGVGILISITDPKTGQEQYTVDHDGYVRRSMPGSPPQWLSSHSDAARMPQIYHLDDWRFIRLWTTPETTGVRLQNIEFPKMACEDGTPLTLTVQQTSPDLSKLIPEHIPGYAVAASQVSPLKGLTSFLLLTPDESGSPDKVLIPCFKMFCKQPLSQQIFPATSNLKPNEWPVRTLLTFDVIDGRLETQSIEGRLFLSYLFLLQRDYESAWRSLKNIPENIPLSQQGTDILGWICNSFEANSDLSPNAASIRLLAHCVLQSREQPASDSCVDSSQSRQSPKPRSQDLERILDSPKNVLARIVIPDARLEDLLRAGNSESRDEIRAMWDYFRFTRDAAFHLPEDPYVPHLDISPRPSAEEISHNYGLSLLRPVYDIEQHIWRCTDEILALEQLSGEPLNQAQYVLANHVRSLEAGFLLSPQDSDHGQVVAILQRLGKAIYDPPTRQALKACSRNSIADILHENASSHPPQRDDRVLFKFWEFHPADNARERIPSIYVAESRQSQSGAKRKRSLLSSEGQGVEIGCDQPSAGAAGGRGDLVSLPEPKRIRADEVSGTAEQDHMTLSAEITASFSQQPLNGLVTTSLERVSGDGKEFVWRLRDGKTPATLLSSLKAYEAYDVTHTRALKKQIEFLIREVPQEKVLSESTARLGGFNPSLCLEDVVDTFLNQSRGAYAALNPFLTKEGMQKIHDLTAQYMLLASRLQQIRRVTKLLETSERAAAVPSNAAQYGECQQESRRSLQQALEALSASRSYDPVPLPELLVIEYRAGILLREDQVGVVTKMLKDKNVFFQLIMGAGKSKILAEILSFCAADGNTLSLLIVPSALFPTATQDTALLSLKYYNQDVVPISFRRHEAGSALYEKLMNCLHQLQDAKDNRKVVMVEPETLQCLELTYYELIEEYGQHPSPLLEEQINVLEDIHDILKTSHVLFDEVDTVLHTRHELNYPVGDPKPIESSRIALMHYLFTAMLDGETMLPNGTSVAATIGLRENKQWLMMRSESKIYETQVKPFLAQRLASFEGLLFSRMGLSPDDRQSFVEYIVGARPEPPRLAEMYESQEPGMQEAAHLVVLCKYLLNEVLPITLARRGDVGYGWSHEKDAEDVIRPYEFKDVPKERSQFGNPYEELAYYFQYTLHAGKGIPQKQILELAREARARAFTQLRTLQKSDHPITLHETDANREFQRLFGVHCDEIPEKMDEARATVNADERRILQLTRDLVTKKVFIFPRRLSSDAQNLADLLGPCNGFSGTLENPLEFPDRVTAYPDVSTQERIYTAILKQEKACPSGETFIHSVNDTTAARMCQELLANHPHLQEFRALIDVGALFTGQSNVSVAQALTEFLHDTSPSMQGVLYFDDRENQLYLLRVGQQTPVKLGTTDAATLRQKGITPDKFFTYYDHRHTRGADIPQMPQARAMVTLGKDVLPSDLAQGLLRMRQVLDTQSVEFVLHKSIRNKMVNEGRTFGDIIEQARLNQEAIGAADALHACKQKIRNIIRQSVRDKMRTRNVTEKARVLQAYRPNFITDVVDAPYTQYRETAQLENTQIVLRRYAEAQLNQLLELNRREGQQFLGSQDIERIQKDVLSFVEKVPYEKLPIMSSLCLTEREDMEVEIEKQQESQTVEQQIETELQKEINSLQSNSPSPTTHIPLPETTNLFAAGFAVCKRRGDIPPDFVRVLSLSPDEQQLLWKLGPHYHSSFDYEYLAWVSPQLVAALRQGQKDLVPIRGTVDVMVTAGGTQTRDIIPVWTLDAEQAAYSDVIAFDNGPVNVEPMSRGCITENDKQKYGDLFDDSIVQSVNFLSTRIGDYGSVFDRYAKTVKNILVIRDQQNTGTPTYRLVLCDLEDGAFFQKKLVADKRDTIPHPGRAVWLLSPDGTVIQDGREPFTEQDLTALQRHLLQVNWHSANVSYLDEHLDFAEAWLKEGKTREKILFLYKRLNCLPEEKNLFQDSLLRQRLLALWPRC